MTTTGVKVDFDDNLVQLATFSVGDEEYVIDIMRIRQIIEPQPITPVPKSPPFFEGVIELRGNIIPIIDLRKRFGMNPKGITRLTKYIIVVVKKRVLGLIVDAVLEVVTVPHQNIKPAPKIVLNSTSKYFVGVCNHENRLLLLLNINKVLTSSEQEQLDFLI